MATTAQLPSGVDAIAARTSSMGYADLYGASDDTGPSSAVAGSVGYVSAQQAAAPVVGVSAFADDAAGGFAGVLQLGHELMDTPAGIAFLIAGGLLLLAWHELER